MTEEEATTKWCPFVRMPIPDGCGYSGSWNNGRNIESGYLAVDKQTTCIGSLCMAWRWFDNSFLWTGKEKRPATDPKNPNGYCGLAGNPCP